MLLDRVRRRLAALPCPVPGYLRLARWWRARDLAVVMYHGVIDRPLAVSNWCQLAADEFRQQIEFLAGTYTVLPLAEVVDRMNRGVPLPDRAACVTFDDGFRNVATTAYPILRQFAVPATVFVITGLVGTDQPAWPEQLSHALAHTTLQAMDFDGNHWELRTAQERSKAYRYLVQHLKRLPVERKEDCLAELLSRLDHHGVPANSPLVIMNWDEVGALARDGLIDFGSHSHTHQILSQCGPERQHQEMAMSRQVLLDRLGRADLFAYPNGGRDDFTPTSQRLLRELGYRCALTTIPGLNRPGQGPFELRRVCVGADTDLDQFELRMIGA